MTEFWMESEESLKQFYDIYKLGISFFHNKSVEMLAQIARKW